MTITNTAKPSAASITNTARVLSAVTWDTILTTWAAETHTWDELVSNMTNTARVSASITNTARPA